MQTQLPVWAQYIQSLGTPFAAFIFGIFAAFISYRQYKLYDLKYRFDLFEKRYKIYEALQDLFGEMLREDKVSSETYSKFAIAAQEANFLFDNEVAAYIEKLNKLISEKRSLERKINRRVDDINFEQLSNQLDKNFDTTTSMMKEVTSMFSKYLKLPR